METWTVTEHRLTWDRVTRTWTQEDRIIATGVSRARADRLIEAGHNRSAAPEPSGSSPRRSMGACPDCGDAVEILYDHERDRPPLCNRCWETATGEGKS